MHKRADDDDAAGRMAAFATPSVVQFAAAYPTMRLLPRGGQMSISDVPHPSAGSPEAVIEGMAVRGRPLRRYLKRLGVTLYNNTSGVGPAYLPAESMEKLRSVAFDLGDVIKPGKGLVAGFKRGTSPDAIRGIMAHELGHAVRHRVGAMNPKVYFASKVMASLLGSAGSLRQVMGDPSGNESLGWSAATALSAIPMVNEEIQASRIGSRLAGLKGLKRLHSFRGVPTYLTLAAAPSLAYGARKLVDKVTGAKKSAEAVKAAGKAKDATTAVKLVRRYVKAMREHGLSQASGGSSADAASTSTLSKESAMHKRASILELLGGGIKPISRYLQLLGGGDKAIVGAYKDKMRHLASVSFNAKNKRYAEKARQAYNDMARARWGRSVTTVQDLPDGGVVRNSLHAARAAAHDAAHNVHEAVPDAYYRWAPQWLQYSLHSAREALPNAYYRLTPEWLRYGLHRAYEALPGGSRTIVHSANEFVNPAVRSELNKALAAQLGTAGVVGGAGVYGIHRIASGSPDGGTQQTGGMA